MRAPSQRGFSLVEILVAMVIALAGTVIIFQVFAVSEGIRRTSTSGGDAQQNGLLALFSIERDARMAGVGLNFLPVLGCTVNAYDAGPPIRSFQFDLVGAKIADGGGSLSDTLTLVYGNSGAMRAPPRLNITADQFSTVFKVDNRFGFNLGDVIIAANQGSPAQECVMRQIQRLPKDPAEDITNDSGNFKTDMGADATANNKATASFNKTGGLGLDSKGTPLTFSAWNNTAAGGGRLLDMGPSPQVLSYYINNGQLWRDNQLVPSVSGPIADGIVQLQVVYGKDTNGDGNVDKWEVTMPAVAPAKPTASDWAQVMALRIALVARSSLAEKPQVVGGACDTTTSAPVWFDPSLASPSQRAFDLSADPNWQCYRYRVFETTVPLRNSIWVQTN